MVLTKILFVPPVLFLLLLLPPYSFISLLGILVVAFIVERNDQSSVRGFAASTRLGFLAPLVPFCGDHTLHLVVLVYLLSLKSSQLISRLAFFSLLPLLWSLCFVFETGAELHWMSSFLLNSEESALHLLGILQNHLRISPPLFLQQYILATEWLAFAVLLTHWISSEDSRSAFFHGLRRGVQFAMLFCVVQFLHIQGYLPVFVPVPNQGEFWNMVGRASGTFSDPNAFGIFAYLFLILMVERLSKDWPRLRTSERTFESLFLIAVLLITLFSGSRTFFLGVGAYLFASFLGSLRNPRLRMPAIFVATLFVAGGTFFSILSLAAPELFVFSPSLHRIAGLLSGILTGDFAELYSRQVFLQISQSVFSDYPVYGVGPAVFPTIVTSYADALRLPLGTWSDNPNSFYFQILCSYGLLGGLSLAYSFSSLRSVVAEERRRGWCSPAVISLLVVFAVGPHHLFDEVRILIAFLFAAHFRIVEFENSSRRVSLVLALSLLILLIPGVVLTTQKSEFGFYTWEKPGDQGGEWSRWSSGIFRTWIHCEDRTATGETVGGEVALLRLRNSSPRDTEVSTTDREAPYLIRSGETLKVELPCSAERTTQGIPIRGSVQQPWSPALSTESPDLRLLGVQVLHVNPGEILAARERQF